MPLAGKAPAAPPAAPASAAGDSSDSPTGPAASAAGIGGAGAVLVPDVLSGQEPGARFVSDHSTTVDHSRLPRARVPSGSGCIVVLASSHASIGILGYGFALCSN